MKLLLLLFLSLSIYAKQGTLIECNKIFEARKDELLTELDKIDEKREEFELYKESMTKILEKKEKALKKREEKLNEILKKAEQLKKDAQKLKKENEQILKNIKEAKSDKISKTYMKMRDSKAAAIFDTMDVKDSARILFGLKASKISKIMAKMDPQKASAITNLLENNKAFLQDNNLSK